MSKYAVDGKMIHAELQAEIIKWILEHKNNFNITNACVENFRAYIYNAKGNHLIGGENVYNFIVVMCYLIAGGKMNIEIDKVI